MDAETTVRAYYDALRAGEPLTPFFACDESVVKFGIGERLTGYAEIREGLTAQTETTADWHVESERLAVTERGDHAWFSDDVVMAWTDLEPGVDYEFESRWIGTLERRPDADSRVDGIDTPWRFVGMHVSAPGGTR